MFRTAPQIPKCPSAITSRGARSPRSRRSRSTRLHVSTDSRAPGSTLTTTFRPSAHPTITTSTAAFSFSSPARTYTPSAHRYTGSRSSSRRLRHASHSACHCSFSRATVLAERGASSPSSPRRARSKSPSASPCRYSSGNSSPTSLVLRANSGRIRLTKRSSNPRTRGRRNVTVPRGVVSLRGFPYPFRYPGTPSTSARRWYRTRPKSSATSASRAHWTSSCIRPRSQVWSVSQVGIDSCSWCVLRWCMAVSSLLGPIARGFSLTRRVHRPPCFHTPRGYLAAALTIPKALRASRR
jgi:hypothetical protein